MKRLFVLVILFPLTGSSQIQIEVTQKSSAADAITKQSIESSKRQAAAAERMSESMQRIDMNAIYKKQYEEVGGGIKFYGNGKYRIIELGGSGFVGKKKLKEKIIKRMDDICLEEKCSYEILKEDSRKAGAGILPYYEIHFTLKNDKNEFITIQQFKENDKNSAKEKLLELNELKNQGIITQEEYDKAAAPHKKILLGL